ncbi:hypothetical protein D8674_018420 [Pyrus ussuriensis x Pyrus communis]|uniref:Uncharacterized protein n=1 Tax=Pyrus ussuriensis x Pyrus communis TaxID=2448454 RepID=A0A5N5G573_9ROSA|nr:hypothetical protein D8674_018420 [Pyrus ussuriensis x Pyrus communis]
MAETPLSFCKIAAMNKAVGPPIRVAAVWYCDTEHTRQTKNLAGFLFAIHRYGGIFFPGYGRP